MAASRRAPWFLACAIALGSCADPPLTSEYDIAGVVTNATTGEGIGGVQISFVSETAYTDSTTTSGDGHYQMRVESDSPYGQVHAERSGYTTEQKTVYFDTRTRRVDLVLQELAPTP